MNLASLASRPLGAFGVFFALTSLASAQGADCTITQQPASQRLSRGAPAVLSLRFTGAPAAVQWFRDGALVFTDDAPTDSSNLVDTPDLGSADGSAATASYFAKVLCPGAVLTSDTATVSLGGGNWGPFPACLRGAATFAVDRVSRGTVISTRGEGGATLLLRGAEAAALDFSAATLSALANTQWDGALELETRATHRGKGWLGAVKGSTNRIRVSRGAGKASFSDLHFTAAGSSTDAAHPTMVCLFNGSTMVARFACGTECDVSTDAPPAGFTWRNVSTDEPEKKLAAILEARWTPLGPRPITLPGLSAQTYVADRVVFSAPNPDAVATGGKVNVQDISLTVRRGTSPASTAPLVTVSNLACTYDGVSLDDVSVTTQSYGAPDTGASTSLLQLTQASRPCIVPPFVGSWTDPGLTVAATEAVAADDWFGATFGGGAFDACELLFQGRAGTTGGTERDYRLSSWSWGTSNGAALAVSATPSTLDILRNGAAGTTLVPGPASGGEWNVVLKNKGTVVRSVGYQPGMATITAALRPVSAGKASFQDIHFVRFPSDTEVTVTSGGATTTDAADVVELQRVVPGLTVRAHAAVRLESRGPGAFDLVRCDFAHRTVQWGDVIVTTGQNSPGLRKGGTGTVRWDIKKVEGTGARFAPTLLEPRGPVTGVTGALLTRTAPRSRSDMQCNRFAAPPYGETTRGTRAISIDLPGCTGVELPMGFDQDTSVTLPPASVPRTGRLLCWGRAGGASTSTTLATFDFADTPPEPDGGMNVTPTFPGASSFRLTLKNGGTTVFSQGGLSGEAAHGLPRSFVAKPCPPPDPGTPSPRQFSFSWGETRSIHHGSGAVHAADELVLEPEDSTGAPPAAATWTSLTVQGANVHDVMIGAPAPLLPAVQRGPRQLMATTGRALATDGRDDDCDGTVDEICGGWLFAGRGRQFATDGGSTSGTTQRGINGLNGGMPNRISMNVTVARSAAPTQDDGVDLLTGQAESCSFSWGLSQTGTGAPPKGAGSGRFAATWQRPTGEQEWGVSFARQIGKPGCVLRPQIPVPVNGYRCTVWDSSDASGGASPAAPDFVTGSDLSIVSPLYPDGFGAKCDQLRAAEPDIVIILFPVPVLLEINGKAYRADAVQIAPQPTNVILPGPIIKTTIKASTGDEAGTAKGLVHRIVVKPITPIRAVDIASGSTRTLSLTWPSPSALPVTTSDLGLFSSVPDADITTLPNGSRRLIRAYPPPDRLFFQLIDLGWEWPPVPASN